MIHRIAYRAVQPCTFEDNLVECVHFIQKQLEKSSIFGLLFFVNATAEANYQAVEKTIDQAFKENGWLFPYNVLAQPGECPICLEAWVDDSPVDVEYPTFEQTRYARSQTTNGKIVCSFGVKTAANSPSLHAQATESLRLTFDILTKEGLSYADIVRQWNYIPDILKIEQHQDKTLQHYQVFNDVRKHWYSKANFTEGYPAATGIGVKTGVFSLDFIAVQQHPAIKRTGLCNPKQQNAYEYDQKHLVGDAVEGCTKNPPLFERAKLLSMGQQSVVALSGTAAILGEDTVGIGDVRRQTEVAINNLLELISPEVTHTAIPYRMEYLRVYIKDGRSLDLVKSVCASTFPEVPITFVEADVCRDDLLMEIEGEAFE